MSTETPPSFTPAWRGCSRSRREATECSSIGRRLLDRCPSRCCRRGTGAPSGCRSDTGRPAPAASPGVHRGRCRRSAAVVEQRRARLAQWRRVRARVEVEALEDRRRGVDQRARLRRHGAPRPSGGRASPERDADDPTACLVHTNPRRQPRRADQLLIHRVAVAKRNSSALSSAGRPNETLLLPTPVAQTVRVLPARSAEPGREQHPATAAWRSRWRPRPVGPRVHAPGSRW